MSSSGRTRPPIPTPCSGRPTCTVTVEADSISWMIRASRGALRDLLLVSWRMTKEKAGPGRPPVQQRTRACHSKPRREETCNRDHRTDHAQRSRCPGGRSHHEDEQPDHDAYRAENIQTMRRDRGASSPRRMNTGGFTRRPAPTTCDVQRSQAASPAPQGRAAW